MTNTTETRGVSMKELAQAFEGKYINVSSVDHYGIAIEMSSKCYTSSYKKND